MILVIKHIGIEGPGSIEEFFGNTAWQFKIVELGQGETLPKDLQDIEAIVSLGGPMNVYEEDKFPFLKEEDGFLKKAVKKEIPVLGICLGAQLLAKACGAKVGKNTLRELGWYQVSLTEEAKTDSLFTGLPAEMTVFQWHQDTFDIPAGAKLLAQNQTCSNQAFRIGRNAYGLQFHIEVTPAMIESWVGAYTGELEGVDTKDMLLEAYRQKELVERQAQAMYLNFAKLIRSRPENRVLQCTDKAWPLSINLSKPQPKGRGNRRLI